MRCTFQTKPILTWLLTRYTGITTLIFHYSCDNYLKLLQNLYNITLYRVAARQHRGDQIQICRCVDLGLGPTRDNGESGSL